MEGTVQKKRLIRKATRVPINLMAAIQRGDLRGSNCYENGRLGTAEIVACEGEDMSVYDPRLFYSQEQIDAYVKDLVDGRRKFTEEIANEGLKPEILQAAEESFSIAGEGRAKSVFIPDKASKEPAKPLEEVVVPGSWESKVRPPRPVGWRYC